jgi:hypothetical protein
MANINGMSLKRLLDGIGERVSLTGSRLSGYCSGLE